MNALKTRAQQRLAWLENVGRSLTEAESDMLRRSLHANYMTRWNANKLAAVRREELETLAKVEAEMNGDAEALRARVAG